MLAPRLMSATQVDYTYHLEQTKKWINLYGTIVVPEMPQQNRVEGPGRTFKAVLEDLNALLGEFIGADENFYKQITANPFIQRMSELRLKSESDDSSFKQRFYEDLCIRQIRCFTYCSYLICSSERFGDNNPLQSQKEFKSLIRYVSLLAAICAYNAAYINCKYINTSKSLADAKHLIDAYHKWMHLFECIDLKDLPENLQRLKTELSENSKELERQMMEKLGYRLMSSTALAFHLSRKNDRALQFGSPFNAKLLYCEEATEFFLPNEQVLAQFYSLLDELTRSNQSQRKQIMMILNREFGQVQVLDISFNPNTKKITVFNMSPSASLAQYVVLYKIQTYLKTLKVPFELYACQADLKGSLYSDPYYAFALIGLCGKQLPETFAHCQKIPQPAFSDIRLPRPATTMPKLEFVQWLPLFPALDEKALLLGPSDEWIRRTLAAQGQIDIDKKLAFYQRKYGKPYRDYLMQELDRRFKKLPMVNAQLIQSRMAAVDRGQALRRAAAGFCPRAEFDELLRSEQEKPTGALNAQDQSSGKQFTPLMCSLSAEYDKATRASALCQAGCDITLKDGQKRDARAHYQAASASSRVKQNLELKRRF